MYCTLVVVLTTYFTCTCASLSPNKYQDVTLNRLNFIHQNPHVDKLKHDVRPRELSDTEERLFGMSWLLSLLERLIPLKWRMAYWLERRRSFDYVKTKLGMQNVPLSELSKHKHYPLFSKYQDDILMIRLTARLNRGDSTYSVWKNLKLDTISPQHDMTINELRHELEKIENTKVFQVYKRYAVMFDKTMSKSLDPTFDEDAVTLEKMARAHIWAENHWQKNDVKSFLGLSYASEDELKRNELYQFFLDKVKERRSAPQQWDL